jgi:hypothetical protein
MRDRTTASVTAGNACTTGLLTHEPPAGVPEWMTGTLISEAIEDAVARAK